MIIPLKTNPNLTVILTKSNAKLKLNNNKTLSTIIDNSYSIIPSSINEVVIDRLPSTIVAVITFPAQPWLEVGRLLTIEK